LAKEKNLYLTSYNLFKSNLLDNIVPSKEREIFETIFKDQKIKIERIVSCGQSSPVDFWYDQDENEFVLLLEGEAKIEFEKDIHFLRKGDYMLIPAHTKHRVAFTAKNKTTVWLAIFWKGL